LRVGEAEGLRQFQDAGESAGKLRFEAIEQPGNAERDNHQNVPPAPRQTIEPRGDVGGDDLAFVQVRQREW